MKRTGQEDRFTEFALCFLCAPDPAATAGSPAASSRRGNGGDPANVALPARGLRNSPDAQRSPLRSARQRLGLQQEQGQHPQPQRRQQVRKAPGAPGVADPVPVDHGESGRNTKNIVNSRNRTRNDNNDQVLNHGNSTGRKSQREQPRLDPEGPDEIEALQTPSQQPLGRPVGSGEEENGLHGVVGAETGSPEHEPTLSSSSAPSPSATQQTSSTATTAVQLPPNLLSGILSAPPGIPLEFLRPLHNPPGSPDTPKWFRGVVGNLLAAKLELFCDPRVDPMKPVPQPSPLTTVGRGGHRFVQEIGSGLGMIDFGSEESGSVVIRNQLGSVIASVVPVCLIRGLSVLFYLFGTLTCLFFKSVRG